MIEDTIDISGDPMAGFLDESYEGEEHSTGFAAEDLVPEQFAILHVEEAEYRDGKREDGTVGTPSVHLRIRLDEKRALTPKRSFFHDVYLGKTKGGQAMLDGLCVMFLGTRMSERFSDEPVSERDQRPKVADVNVAGRALAVMLKGKSGLGAVTIKKGGKNKAGQVFADRNVIGGMYRMTDENLAAMAEVGYRPGTLSEKERTGPDGKRQRYLAVKPSTQRGAAAAPVGATSPVDL